MIIEWFLNWTMAVTRWLVDLLPDWDFPPELSNPGGLLDSIISNVTGLGIWLDWGALTTLAVIPFGVWVTGIIWKAARTAFSHFPLIGGSG